MSITRRLFIRNAAAVGAVGATVTAATAEEAPERTQYEQAIWHIRELERLIAEDGGINPIILVQGTYGPKDFRCLCLNSYGQMKLDGDLFRRNPAQLRGGEA